MKFRKKPIEVEAKQWFPGVEIDGVRERGAYAVIDAPEGLRLVDEGDWIVTDAAGERFPIKPDVFAATYEFVP